MAHILKHGADAGSQRDADMGVGRPAAGILAEVERGGEDAVRARRYGGRTIEYAQPAL